MPVQQDFRKRKGGFALIVVLAVLIAVTLLFATTSSLSMRQAQSLAAERTLERRDTVLLNAATIALARLAADDDAAKEPFSVSIGEKRYRVQLQDVGGLVDLNTADPELLARVFAALGLGPGAETAYTKWRRDDRQLVRLEDFVRITGADPALLPRLKRVATVYSRSSGIAPAEAPPDVLALFSGSGSVPTRFRSDPSTAIFLLTVKDDAGRDLTATISAPNGGANGEILEF